MQKRLFSVFLVLIIACTGCIEDQCNGVLCRNDGVCIKNDGTCSCLQGFEGDFCENEWADKFIDKWSIQESDNRGNATASYELSTIYSSAPDTFYLLGLATDIDSALCVRSAFLSYTIAEKELSETYKLQGGEGTIDTITGIVTGVYSFVKDEATTTVNYTLTPQ